MATDETTIEAYTEQMPKSQALAERAGRVIPRKVTHDARFFEPFPHYVVGAQGSRKWDVDGHEYVDYAGGHGALLLGHNHPKIVGAIQDALTRGTHFGASHEREIEWAELVTQLIPSGELVEFTLSGTEANMLALRLARAYTGRERVIKFQDHFHGWYDQLFIGLSEPFDLPATLGLPESCLSPIVVLPPNDIEAVRAELVKGNVAAVILEPSGARAGRLPAGREFLEALREETERAGSVLVFDEVITGFRWAPGGAQEYYGVTPDLTTLGKIIGGGMPSGGVTGKAAIMRVMEYGRDVATAGPTRVSHTGTYNANPVAAASGVAMLRQVATGEPTRKAAETAAALRQALTDVLRRTGISGCIYGEVSVVHIHLAPPDRCPPVNANGTIPPDYPLERLLAGKQEATANLKRAMLVEGVDLLGDHAWVSAAHTQEDVDWTAEAFDRALRRMLAEGMVQRR